MIVERRARDLSGERLARAPAKSGGSPAAIRTTIRRGTGSSSSTRPLPSHGSSSRADSSLRIGPHARDTGRRPTRSPPPCCTSASMSRCSEGRIWIVISRATADCHSPAAERTSTTRAERQRGEEGHDRDDGEQRAAGDRVRPARSGLRNAAARPRPRRGPACSSS